MMQASTFMGTICISLQKNTPLTNVHGNTSVNITDYPKATFYKKLECGPMPNLMVALPNIGGALCSTPQSLADAHY